MIYSYTCVLLALLPERRKLAPILLTTAGNILCEQHLYKASCYNEWEGVLLMESVSGMAAASGGSEQRLLQCFRESTGSILQLFELQQWWRQGDSKEKEEEVEVRASGILIEPWLSPYVPSCVCFSLQQLLQQLVERGEVGCRVLTARGSQYTMYWLKKQYGTYDDGDLELCDELLT